MFHTQFPNTGDFIVKAKVSGIAKNQSFGFIKSLGKVAKGGELLKPQNWDSVVLILLFGVTMWLSQKFTVAKQQPGLQLDEQQMAQQQAMKTMPLMVTAMFFFIPLPTGVYLYMVISNVVQSLQTWMIMQQPVPPLVDVIDNLPATPESSQNGSNGKHQTPTPKKKASSSGKPEAVSKPSAQSEQVIPQLTKTESDSTSIKDSPDNIIKEKQKKKKKK
jgi:YidC/Oxa1 family membrane protein insertase